MDTYGHNQAAQRMYGASVLVNNAGVARDKGEITLSLDRIDNRVLGLLDTASALCSLSERIIGSRPQEASSPDASEKMTAQVEPVSTRLHILENRLDELARRLSYAQGGLSAAI